LPEQSSRPRLVILGGAPGSGKSTLARRLATDLELPVLGKDLIKEILADAFAVASRAESRALGVPTFAIFFALLGELLDAGISVIAEGNFRRGISEGELAPLVARSRAVYLHCQTTRELSVRRVVERYRRGERHPRHFDAEYLAETAKGNPLADWESYAPLDLAAPTLLVDTTDGYQPRLDEIVAFVRSAT
jgi:predicted kinase